MMRRCIEKQTTKGEGTGNHVQMGARVEECLPPIKMEEGGPAPRWKRPTPTACTIATGKKISHECCCPRNVRQPLDSKSEQQPSRSGNQPCLMRGVTLPTSSGICVESVPLKIIKNVLRVFPPIRVGIIRVRVQDPFVVD